MTGGPEQRDEPRTAREMLARGREFLERKGVAAARREAELLVAHALELSRLELFLALDRPLSRAEVVRGRELLARRAKREPTAYLTGRREFYGREFQVGPGVLVPRPETELLLAHARRRLARGGAARIADLGTGSGCIAITLALELPHSRVCAVDISAAALEFARANAQRLDAAVEFVHGDGLEPLRARAPFELLVSNPPYVDPAARAELEPEVREHEPAEALFAPPGDPDHWARRCIAGARELVAPGGGLLIELGHDQAARARAWHELDGLEFALHRDLERVERVLEVQL